MTRCCKKKKKSSEKCINNPPAVSQKASHLPYKENVLVNRLSVMFRAAVQRQIIRTQADVSITVLYHIHMFFFVFFYKGGMSALDLENIKNWAQIAASFFDFSSFSLFAFFKFIFPLFLFIFFSTFHFVLNQHAFFFTVWKNVTQEKLFSPKFLFFFFFFLIPGAVEFSSATLHGEMLTALTRD